MAWARYHARGYECSSAGDRRFSALYARLRDGRTIEEAYQLDLKGYRAYGSDWRLGKGRPAINGLTQEELWAEYVALWDRYLSENPGLLEDLRTKSAGLVLTDRFATSTLNQAHALDLLLTASAPAPGDDPFTF